MSCIIFLVIKLLKNYITKYFRFLTNLSIVMSIRINEIKMEKLFLTLLTQILKTNCKKWVKINLKIYKILSKAKRTKKPITLIKKIMNIFMAIHMIIIKIINLKCQKIRVEMKGQIKKIDMKKAVVRKINSKIKAAQPIVLKVEVQKIFIKGK